MREAEQRELTRARLFPDSLLPCSRTLATMVEDTSAAANAKKAEGNAHTAAAATASAV